MIAEKLDWRIYEARQARCKIIPCHTNRASELGHPCERYLYYCRAKWSEAQAPDPALQGIFEDGNLHEQAVRREIETAGVTFLEQQRPFEWPQYNITGTIDGKIVLDGAALPIEIKSMAGAIYDRIRTFDDLKAAKQIWLRKYPGQMTLYLLMSNSEFGVICCKNKWSAAIKFLDVRLDYGLGEEMLKKAERVNVAIQTGAVPDYPPYDDSMCARCRFFYVCGRDKDYGAGIDIVTEGQLLELAEELAALDATIGPVTKAIKQRESIADKIKAICKGRPETLVGNYVIASKKVLRKGYEVKEKTYWDTRVHCLSIQKKDADDD